MMRYLIIVKYLLQMMKKIKLMILLTKDNLKLELDLSNFERSCYLINKILTKFYYFFCTFELKDKFRFLKNET